MARTSTLAKRFAGVLLLSSSLTFVALDTAQARTTDLQRFFDSGYTYCDAKLIGALWSIDVGQAKAQIGMKIRTGIGGNIPRVLQLSRQQGNRCTWEDTGLGYEDAQQLAEVWGTPDPYRAKLKAAKYYTRGQSSIVQGALGNGD